MAVLEFLARTAGAGFVAADLAPGRRIVRIAFGSSHLAGRKRRRSGLARHWRPVRFTAIASGERRCFGMHLVHFERLGLRLLGGLLDQFDAREMLHVTFGSALARYGTEIKSTLRANEDAHYAAIEAHFDRHLAAFAEGAEGK